MILHWQGCISQCQSFTDRVWSHPSILSNNREKCLGKLLWIYNTFRAQPYFVKSRQELYVPRGDLWEEFSFPQIRRQPHYPNGCGQDGTVMELSGNRATVSFSMARPSCHPGRDKVCTRPAFQHRKKKRCSLQAPFCFQGTCKKIPVPIQPPRNVGVSLHRNRKQNWCLKMPLVCSL